MFLFSGHRLLFGKNTNNWKGAPMISSTYQFQQFADAVKGKDFLEIIYMAEQEAIETWRVSHPSNGLDPSVLDRSKSYQQKLLGLITVLRNGVRPGGFSSEDYVIFETIIENARNHAA
jgi:hypothetical protein